MVLEILKKDPYNASYCHWLVCIDFQKTNVFVWRENEDTGPALCPFQNEGERDMYVL
jgi:hypothetical protein